MTYNPTTDRVALWRNNGDGSVSNEMMPGLDFVIAALARAGVITLVVSATAPIANQNVTAWLNAAVPSYSGEGALMLWDKVTSAYLPATPGLFLQFLEACAGESGISWWQTTGGQPSNVIGNDGDFAIRTDVPGGIYGPKANGAWPTQPLPGTTNTIESAALDNTFGNVKGTMIYRDAAQWEGLAIGLDDAILISLEGIPVWSDVSSLLDAVFSSVQGSILYRDSAGWKALGPGTAGFVLTSNGPGANPSYTVKSSEFTSGTSMIFHQSAAPLGWTKSTALNDCALRVVSGTAGTTNGSTMSAVFSQTAVQNTTLTVPQMPSHSHVGSPSLVPNSGASGSGIGGGGTFGPPSPLTIATAGNDQPHTHSINLALAYTDVIIATKN